jgi:NifU-like protein involved in Fe-S cluster formation
MDLYQELILEHYKRPVRAGLREPFEAEVRHVNPTCGDEVTLRVHVALAGVAKYPARIKCALLSWMAFSDALHQAEGAQQ